MRCDWRHGVLVGLAMALAVPAVKPARAAPCRGTACMPADRSPLGLSYRMVADFLDKGGGAETGPRIEALGKVLAANPGDDLARLELIALGGDERGQAAIAASLADIAAKAEKAGDRLVSAWARLLAIGNVEADGEEGDAKVSALVESMLADARALRAGSRPADDADLLAGLLAYWVVDALDSERDDNGRDVDKAQDAAVGLAVEAFAARLQRAPRDVGRFAALVAMSQRTVRQGERPQADRLVELCRRWLALAPASETARSNLVTALVLRAARVRRAGDVAAARADAEALVAFAQPARAGDRLDNAARRALMESYRIRAELESPSDPLRAAGILADGLQRLQGLEKGGSGERFATDSLILAGSTLVGELIDKPDPSAAEATENRMLAALAEPGHRAQLRDLVASHYRRRGATAAVMQHYRSSLTELLAAPLDEDRSWRFVGAAQSLFDLARKEPRTFDAEAHARLLTAYAAEPRLRALDGLSKEEKASLVLRLADALHQTARRLEEMGIEAPRLGLLEREIALREPLAQDSAERSRRLDDLAWAYRELCDAYHEADREQDAVTVAYKRVAIRREQMERNPNAYDEISASVWAMRDLGDEQRHAGDDRAGQESYREAGRIAQTLLDGFPDKSGSYEAMAAVQIAMGQAARSTMMKLVHFKKAEATNLSQFEKLGEKGGDHDGVAVSAINIGDTYLDAGKYQAALTHLAKALAASDKSLAADADSNALLRRRTRILDKIAQAEQALGRTDAAIATRRRQIEVLEKLAAQRGGAVETQADTYGALIGLLESQDGHADEIAALRRKIAAL